MATASEKIEDYNFHMYGTPKNAFIDKVTQMFGTLFGIIHYGTRYTTGEINRGAMTAPDRIYTQPMIQMKKIYGELMVVTLIFATISFLMKFIYVTMISVGLAGIFYYLYKKTINPVFAIINGPSHEYIKYATSFRAKESRLTLDGFRKLFDLDRLITSDILFFAAPEMGRHAVTSSKFNDFLMDDKYILRTFVDSYQMFRTLFADWERDPVKFRSVATEIGLVTIAAFSKAVTGFTRTPLEVLDILEEVEDALINQTPFWEIFGYRIALTEAQKKYLHVRYHYAEVAKKYYLMNKQVVLDNPDNLTMQLAKRVAELRGGPDADPKEYLDDIEISHGMLAVLMAAGNPSTILMNVFYLLSQHPEYTAKLQQDIDLLVEETKGMTEEAMLKHVHNRTKSCSGVEQILYYYNEAVRYTTPTSVVTRYCPYSIKVHGHDLPKGSILVTNLRSQCRDPSQWEDPEKFNPARFEKGGYVLHTYPFVPFSAGERKCPGFMTTRALFFGFLFAMRGNLYGEGRYEVVEDTSRPLFDLPRDTTLVRVSRIHRAALKKI